MSRAYDRVNFNYWLIYANMSLSDILWMSVGGYGQLEERGKGSIDPKWYTGYWMVWVQQVADFKACVYIHGECKCYWWRVPMNFTKIEP